MPGRSDAAGLHHGHEAVTQALAQQASEDTTVSIVEVTEVIAAGARAVVIVRFAGVVDGEPWPRSPSTAATNTVDDGWR